MPVRGLGTEDFRVTTPTPNSGISGSVGDACPGPPSRGLDRVSLDAGLLRAAAVSRLGAAVVAWFVVVLQPMAMMSTVATEQATTFQVNLTRALPLLSLDQERS